MSPIKNTQGMTPGSACSFMTAVRGLSGAFMKLQALSGFEVVFGIEIDH